MANQFVNLPTTVGNGTGASVNVTTFGALKTIVCQGAADATINVEFNNDVTPNGTWAPVATFQGTGQITLNVAARWMRIRTTNYNSDKGGTTQVDMGGTDDGTTFASLPVPAATGVGAAVNVSALPLYKTVQVGDAFRGTLIVEVSEDGSEWAQPFSFQTPGSQSQVIAAQWMRVRRVGVPMIAPGTPLVNVGATSASGGAGDQGVAISAGTSSQASGTVDFVNSNGITFGMSAGTVTGSVAAGAAISAGSQSAGSGTVVFSNSNGVTFGMSGSSRVTASYSQSTNLAAAAAGTQTQTSGTVVFANSNGVTFGMSGSSQITASVAASTSPSGIAAGTQTATSGTVVFSNSNNVSFGMSGSSRITASATQASTSVSQFELNGFVSAIVVSSFTQTMMLQKVAIPVFCNVTQAVQALSITQSVGSQSTGSVQVNLGIYTMNHSTASLLASGSRMISWTSGAGSTGNQYGGVSGAQWRSIPLNVNITPGDYLLAYHYTSSGVSILATVAGFGNVMGMNNDIDSIASTQWLNGYSNATFSSALPTSIVVTDANYVRTGGTAARYPGIMFYGTF